MQGMGERVGSSSYQMELGAVSAAALCLPLTWELPSARDISPSPAPSSKQMPSGCRYELKSQQEQGIEDKGWER